VIEPPSDQLADNPTDMLDPLFSGTPVRKAINDRRRRVAEVIAALQRHDFLERGPDDLEAELVERWRIDLLVLNWDDKKGPPSDVEDRTQPAEAIGTGITLFVPFLGPLGLFHWRPSTHAGKPPRGFVWAERHLLSYSAFGADSPTVQRELHQQEAAIKQWVSWVNREATVFNDALPGLIRSALTARRDKIRAGEDLVAALGVPRAAFAVPRAALGVPRRLRRTSGRGRIEANETEPPNMLSQNSADLFRTRGWSGLGKVTPTQTKEHREAEPPKSGRPPGSGWLIVDRAELLKKYRQLQQQSGRRPLQREFAQSVDMSARTLRTYLKRFELSWPPE
jgi:hypothetical protein